MFIDIRIYLSYIIYTDRSTGEGNRDWETGRYWETQSDIHTARQTDRQTDRHTEKETHTDTRAWTGRPGNRQRLVGTERHDGEETY